MFSQTIGMSMCVSSCLLNQCRVKINTWRASPSEHLKIDVSWVCSCQLMKNAHEGFCSVSVGSTLFQQLVRHLECVQFINGRVVVRNPFFAKKNIFPVTEEPITWSWHQFSRLKVELTSVHIFPAFSARPHATGIERKHWNMCFHSLEPLNSRSRAWHWKNSSTKEEVFRKNECWIQICKASYCSDPSVDVQPSSFLILSPSVAVCLRESGFSCNQNRYCSWQK